MKIIYTLIVAIICAAFLVAADLFFQKVGKSWKIFNKNYIRMPVVYFVGILLFLIAIRIVYSL